MVIWHFTIITIEWFIVNLYNMISIFGDFMLSGVEPTSGNSYFDIASIKAHEIVFVFTDTDLIKWQFTYTFINSADGKRCNVSPDIFLRYFCKTFFFSAIITKLQFRAGSEEKNQPRKGSSESAARENTTTEGYGSSQRRDQENVGPLDADLNELPSKRRSSGDNTTGSGLG